MLELLRDWFNFYLEEYRPQATVSALLSFLLLERFFALREAPPWRRGWWQDLTYVLFNPILIKAGATGLIFVLGLGPFLKDLVPLQVRQTVHNLPVWASFPLALLIADLGFYAVHRMFHRIPWLWPFHAVHHSSEHLDTLAAVRIHPVDQVLTKVVSLLPLFALDFSTATIVSFSGFYFIQTFYIHSNVRFTFGPLRWILATQEFHHRHHGDHPDLYDKNFAAQLPLWDFVFGTLSLPKKSWPEKYGLSYPIPDGFFLQLAYPFTHLLQRFRKPAVAATLESPIPADPVKKSEQAPIA